MLELGAWGAGGWPEAGGRGRLAEVEERSGWGLGGARRRDREGERFLFWPLLGFSLN